MNIVQLQYKLRDLPMSAVQAAANGRDPSIPELLATMEMNRRERLEQSAAKPPAKSIKEQLEQKLSAQPQEQMGLPGMLQQAQQANGEPQQDQVQQPGQQPQGDTRMGGVASLPAGGAFKQFNNGGIVAFAEGDLVEDESAAETARLKRAEEIAAARELLDVSGVNKPAVSQPVAKAAAPAPQAPAANIPADAQRAYSVVQNAPFVNEASNAIKELTSVETTTPEQEMEKRQALLDKYGIRPPKEDEMARIEASNKAYEKDRQARTEYQAMQALAKAARPNAWGKYMPGNISETTSTFGLSNLEVDRTFREANEKAQVAAKEAQRAFKMDNLSDAISASRKSEEYKREASKAAATALGQMAERAISGTTQVMTNEENKRYHDMWANLEDKKLKAQIARDGQERIPELMKNIEYIKKNFPSLYSSMTPDQLLNYSADKIARLHGAEGLEAKLNLKNKEDFDKAVKEDSVLRDLNMKLTKAYKNKSQIEIDEVNKQIDDRTAQIRKGFGPISIGTTGGIPTALPQNAPQKSKYQMTKDGKLVEQPNP
jgi:hypothetical protein